MTPGDYITARRRHYGHTRAEIAAMSDVDYDRLSAIEDGRLVPLGWEIEAISATLRDDFDVLNDLVAGRASLRLCRWCGCHEHDACIDDDGPCGWAAADACTHCRQPQRKAA